VLIEHFDGAADGSRKRTYPSFEAGQVYLAKRVLKKRREGKE
jgi:hypothetical protein